MYASMACGCWTYGRSWTHHIPALYPYFFTSSSLHYLCFSKNFNVLVCLLFWWPLAILNDLTDLPPPASTLLASSVFSIPLQAYHQEPERKASLNYGCYSTGSQLPSHAQDRLIIPHETELKAAYIRLAPNERTSPWQWQCGGSALACKSVRPSPVL